MKIISWNVNGIRAVERKEELGKFIKKYDPDVVCFQETKAQPEQLDKIKEKYSDYEQYYHSAEKKGYAGTGIWIKKTLPKHEMVTGMTMRDDNEGRVSRVDVNGYSILGVYFPNGGKSNDAWEDKLVFYEHFLETVNDLRKKGRKVIWCGDVNCAHQYIDIKRAKENDGKIGFHPKERAWIDKCVEQGWVDIWRNLNPDTEKYTWWNLFTKARDRNVGWRIDYFFMDKADLKLIKKTTIENDQTGSDHCPILLEV